MQSTLKFNIKQWAAWAPNIDSPEDGLRGSMKPYPSFGDQAPDVSAISAMQRRRLNRITRMAYHVVNQIDGTAHLPQVYCSRHGDLPKSTELLIQLAHQEPLSSLNFGLSVHNAVAGNISILQNNIHPITSLAACAQGIACALLEAVTQAYEIHGDVLLVVYDEQVPDVYAAKLEYRNNVAFAYALLISEGDGFEMTWRESSPVNVIFDLPPELMFLAWLLNENSFVWTFDTGRAQWQWRKSK